MSLNSVSVSLRVTVSWECLSAPQCHSAFREYFDPSQIWTKFSQEVTDDIEIILDDEKAMLRTKGTVRVESKGIKYFVYIKKRQCVDCDTGQVTRYQSVGTYLTAGCVTSHHVGCLACSASFTASVSLSDTVVLPSLLHC